MSKESNQVDVQWTEGRIGALLNRHLFKRTHLVVVPNTYFAGYEADLLAVTRDRRLIDVEIKISRSDLKADAKKEKWTNRSEWKFCEKERRYTRIDIGKREWPSRIWKHYYAMPAEIWKDDLIDCLPSDKSGIILLDHDGRHFTYRVHRRVKPRRGAEKLTDDELLNIARLATLRMWDAIERREPAPKITTPAPEDDWAR